MLSTLISGLSLSSSQQLSKVVKLLCIQGNSKRGRHGEVADQVLKPCLTLDLHLGPPRLGPTCPLPCSLSPSSLSPDLWRMWQHSGQDSSVQQRRPLGSCSHHGVVWASCLTSLQPPAMPLAGSQRGCLQAPMLGFPQPLAY